MPAPADHLLHEALRIVRGGDGAASADGPPSPDDARSVVQRVALALRDEMAALRQRAAQLSLRLDEGDRREAALSSVLDAIRRSPSDVRQILDAIVTMAARLCDAEFAFVADVRDGWCHLAAANRVEAAHLSYFRDHPVAVDRDTVMGRVALLRRTIHVADVLADADFKDLRWQKVGRQRTVLGVPLLWDEDLIGVIVLARTRVLPFNDDQVRLLITFADQATIALGNARTMVALEQRTAELDAALEQQTAKSEVLQAISRSSFDLVAVLGTLISSAVRLCRADIGTITRERNGQYFRAAVVGFPHQFVDLMTTTPVALDRSTVTGRVLAEKSVVQIADALADPEYHWSDAQLAGRFRTLLGIPLMRAGVVVGALVVGRVTVSPFSPREIALVTGFADQAVIAIENARLFEELQARTAELQDSLDYQTVTSDVLKAISRSTFRLRPVLETLLDNAVRFCRADKGILFRIVDGHFKVEAAWGLSDDGLAWLDAESAQPVRAQSIVGMTMATRRIVHVEDVQTDPRFNWEEAAQVVDFRAGLGIPLLRDGDLIGIFTLVRTRAEPFTARQIELVEVFADQAVIAMQNAGLLAELQDQTDALTRSLDDLRRTQDRLVQTEKLASLGQLTAGIAHEIKNPLNFVNNFAELSAGLVDELRDAVGILAGTIPAERRDEIEALAALLTANLARIVQHGKRADLIVRNMLLHSRGGTGEARAIDFNTVVDEALNLAFHGARAERPGFDVTIHRHFDPQVGEVVLHPQEFTRVLLNLVGNAFHATGQRLAADPSATAEVTILTRSLGLRVRVKIRDNGVGIPEDVLAHVFEPFFTTKPAGQGTGLGLSISHDIVVKQHGGKIEVFSEPGRFTEFVVTIPRRPPRDGAAA